MGSLLTVLLAESRYINLALLTTFFTSKYFNNNIIISTLFWIFVIHFIDLMIPDKYFNFVFNYYETPLGSKIEIPLVYLLSLILLYYNYTYDNMKFISSLLILYTFVLYRAIFPSGEGIDKMAADNFWNNNF